jgi:DNA-binding MarR family transcriptional regulator
LAGTKTQELSMGNTTARIDTIAKTCIAMRLRLLSRVVTRIYDAALRPLGLKTSQVNILVAAWRLGLASPLRVCAVLQMDPSTLSRNVERMRARGWVEVVPADDAREQPFRLTDAGRKLLEQAVPRWEQAQAQARRVLGEEGVAVLRKTVKRVRRTQVQP